MVFLPQTTPDTSPKNINSTTLRDLHKSIHHLSTTIESLFPPNEHHNSLREIVCDELQKESLRTSLVIYNCSEGGIITSQVSSFEKSIATKVLALSGISPGCIEIVGRLGNSTHKNRPLHIRLINGARLPFFKDLAAKLALEPSLAHLRVRKMETPLERQNGYTQRNRKRNGLETATNKYVADLDKLDATSECSVTTEPEIETIETSTQTLSCKKKTYDASVDTCHMPLSSLISFSQFLTLARMNGYHIYHSTFPLQFCGRLIQQLAAENPYNLQDWRETLKFLHPPRLCGCYPSNYVA